MTMLALCMRALEFVERFPSIQMWHIWLNLECEPHPDGLVGRGVLLLERAETLEGWHVD